MSRISVEREIAVENYEDPLLQNELTWGLSYRLLKEKGPSPIAPKHSPLNVPFKLCRALEKKRMKRCKCAAASPRVPQLSLLDRCVLNQGQYMELLSIPNKTVKKVKKKRKKTTCNLEPCPPRLIQMAVPSKRYVLENWKQYQNFLPTEMLLRFDRILKSCNNLEPRDARYYFKKLQKMKRIAKKRKCLCKKRKKEAKRGDEVCLNVQISVLVEAILKFISCESWPALDCYEMLISNQLLRYLECQRVLKIDSRNTKNVYKKTLIEICDKLVHWIETISFFAEIQPVNSKEMMLQIPSLVDIIQEEEKGRRIIVEEGEETKLLEEEAMEEAYEGVEEFMAEKIVDKTKRFEDEVEEDAVYYMFKDLDEDILEKLIQILSESSDAVLAEEIDNENLPGVTYEDVLEKLKEIRDGHLERQRRVDLFLEDRMIEWVKNNEPESLDDKLLDKIHETSLILSELFKRDRSHIEGELVPAEEEMIIKSTKLGVQGERPIHRIEEEDEEGAEEDEFKEGVLGPPPESEGEAAAGAEGEAGVQGEAEAEGADAVQAEAGVQGEAEAQAERETAEPGEVAAEAETAGEREPAVTNEAGAEDPADAEGAVTEAKETADESGREDETDPQGGVQSEAEAANVEGGGATTEEESGIAAPGEAEAAAPGEAEVAKPGEAEAAVPGEAEVAAPGEVEAAAPGKAESAPAGRSKTTGDLELEGLEIEDEGGDLPAKSAPGAAVKGIAADEFKEKSDDKTQQLEEQKEAEIAMSSGEEGEGEYTEEYETEDEDEEYEQEYEGLPYEGEEYFKDFFESEEEEQFFADQELATGVAEDAAITRPLITAAHKKEADKLSEHLERLDSLLGVIRGHKPSRVFEHQPGTICCLSLKTWAVWLLEIANNANNWTKWISKIIKQVRYYADVIRGDVVLPNGEKKVLYKEEWRNFVKDTEENVVAWKQYSNHVKDLSTEIMENFHGKPVTCCQKCLQDHLIKNVVTAHETLLSLTEAINCAGYWQRCLDRIVEETSKITDVVSAETPEDIVSIGSEESYIIEIEEITELPKVASEGSVYEIEELTLPKPPVTSHEIEELQAAAIKLNQQKPQQKPEAHTKPKKSKQAPDKRKKGTKKR